MIDFSFADNQLAVRDMAREFAARIVAPSIQEFDRKQKPNPELLPALAEAAAANAVQVFGAYGFSDEYPAERFCRNAKGASIYEGSREVRTLIQADYSLGIRKEKPSERNLPIVEQ